MFLTAQNDAMLITAIFDALGNFFAKIIGGISGCSQANQKPQEILQLLR